LNHIDFPYPNDDERRFLALTGQINENQVKAWFANKRNRSSYSKFNSGSNNQKNINSIGLVKVLPLAPDSQHQESILNHQNALLSALQNANLVPLLNTNNINKENSCLLSNSENFSNQIQMIQQQIELNSQNSRIFKENNKQSNFHLVLNLIT
jgi:hypothetical protein